jgi:hypothetical protein
MADLFSCPFCGGSDVSPSSFDVKCMECGVEMPGGTERAIAAWNRRVPSPDMREAVEALTLMRDRLLQNGEWDDGCFYYHGTSASELQEPLALADAAIRSLTGAKP